MLLLTPGPAIAQDYMEGFLSDINQEITSFKCDFKSCLQGLRKEITAVGDRVDDLEHTVDLWAEDQEA
ncbi:hypothetical protein NDU88_004412 [Pleurodeles waltl]|uniref:Uncharacterized protein n=1 Tax=Pleurodeles waltl TaxID=8319 RepID=A0AAV7LLA6_PLEWA|nr:hypothetical protein NDU88_004412 [Pleurodeles waltl]